jgi:PAS domain S-box-containing protein
MARKGESMELSENNAAHQHIAYSARHMGWTTLLVPLGFYMLSEIPASFPEFFYLLLTLHLLVLVAIPVVCKQLLSSITQQQIHRWTVRFVILRTGLYVIFTTYISFATYHSHELNWFYTFNLIAWCLSLEVLGPAFAPWRRFAFAQLSILTVPAIILIPKLGPNIPPGLLVIFGLFFITLILRIQIQHKMFLEKIALRLHLADALDKKQALLDALPIAVSWIDDQFNYIMVNDACVALNGTSKENFIGQPLGFKDLNFKKILLEQLELARRNHPHSITFTKTETDANGNQRTFQWTIKLYRSNKADSFIVMSKDITDLEAAEQTLVAEREKSMVSARLVSLGEMSAGIAHEIKNPLAIITGNTMILRHEFNKELAQNPNAGRRVGIIEDAAKRISTIIDSMQRLSRETKSVPHQWVSVQELIASTIPMISERLRIGNIGLTIELTPNTFVKVQGLQIEQIILNLITNAYDVIRFCEDARIIIHDRICSDNSYELVIADNGPGASDPDKLFVPFYTTKPPGVGTGLGLSLSKRLATQNNADLSYQRQNEFTQFILTFGDFKTDHSETTKNTGS